MNDHRPFKREDLGQAKRIVIKLGSSSLTRADGGFDFNRVDQVAELVAHLVQHGKEVLLVSSGAVAAGRGFLGIKGKPKDLATAQACAAMGQGLLVSHWQQAFQAHYKHVAQILLTLDDVTRRSSYINAQAALEKLLGFGVIPVINENDTVATNEIRFGDNDRLATLVAEIVAADALILLTDVDGLYTAPPSDPDARLISFVACADQLTSLRIEGSTSGLGTGGMTTKLTAATMATSAGIPVYLTGADQLTALFAGENVGTFFEPRPARRPARPNWVANAALPAGKLVIDDGAASALLAGDSSLLAAGITQVEGNFRPGQVVQVIYEGEEIARGVSSYDADYVSRISGKTSPQINPADPSGVRPVVHRDDLVLTINTAPH